MRCTPPAAVVAADAIDRHARNRPVKYWYPGPSGPPLAGAQTGYAEPVDPPAGSVPGAKARRQPAGIPSIRNGRVDSEETE
jgi:hypothetical protein